MQYFEEDKQIDYLFWHVTQIISGKINTNSCLIKTQSNNVFQHLCMILKQIFHSSWFVKL